VKKTDAEKEAKDASEKRKAEEPQVAAEQPLAEENTAPDEDCSLRKRTFNQMDPPPVGQMDHFFDDETAESARVEEKAKEKADQLLKNAEFSKTRKHALLSELERATKVTEPAGSDLERDVCADNGGTAEAPSSSRGRNTMVEPVFDPVPLGGEPLPRLDNLTNEHIGAGKDVDVKYFWHGAMLFAFDGKQNNLQYVNELLKKRFYPVRPTSPIQCSACSKSFYNPIQAKNHRKGWEINGVCDPERLSMELGFSPSAFFDRWCY
jgi:hypothetical protein